jgi:DNA polymerase-3 subunit beta
MEIRFNSKDLEKAVQAANKVISGKLLSSVLSGILIKAEGDKVQFVATNYEVVIRYDVSAQVVDPGKVLISGKLLYDLIKRMPGNEITLKTGVKDNMLTVKGSSKAVYDILLMDAILYPDIELLASENATQLKGTVLHEIYRKMAYAVADSMARPIFAGINFKFSENELVATGTDTHRLSRKTFNVSGKTNDFIITVKSLADVSSLVEADEEITLFSMSGKVVFVTDQLYYQSQIISGAFPDVDRVIPTELSLRVTVERQELLSAIDRLSVISISKEQNITTNNINLTFSQEEIVIQGNSAAKGIAFEQIPAGVDGLPIKIRLDGTQVVECLKSLDCEQVILSFNKPLTPGTITADNDDDYVHVICPIRNFD